MGETMVNNISRRAFAAGVASVALGLAACSKNDSAEQKQADEKPAETDQSSNEAQVNDTTAAASDDRPRPSKNGRLHVDGARLVDEKGNAVQLKGFSTHGLAWYGQYVNKECFAELAGWGSNLARLALYTHESDGWCTDGNQDKLRVLLDNGVEYATAADMYVIIDWHVLRECNPLVYLDQAKEFWYEASRAYSDQANVIYEICNEPNGDTTWDDVRAYAEQVIPIIRSNDARAPIIVGTTTWAQDVDKAAAAPLSFDNVLYALHFYAGTHKDDLRNRLRTAVEGGLPVFVSEYGVSDSDADDGTDLDSANVWMALLDELGLSCACWSLCNNGEAAAMIASTCEKTSGFEDGDLSICGAWYKAMLSGKAETAVEAAADGRTSGSASGSSTAADGVASVTVSDGLACALSVRQTWEDGGKKVNLYDVAVTNPGGSSQVNGWSVDLAFNASAITLTDSWNATVTQSGTKLHLEPASNNATIAGGATASDIGIIVKFG